MKFKLFIYIMFLIIFLNCESEKIEVSNFFSPKEKVILKAATDAVNYDYGYDQSLKLENIFPKNKMFLEIKDEDKLLTALKNFDKKSVISFYEKILMLKKMAIFEMKKYSTREEWKEYTYLKKYLLPSINRFHDSIRKSVIILDPAYNTKLAERNKVIIEKIKDHYKKIVIAEYERNNLAGSGFSDSDFDWDSYFMGLE